MGPPLPLWATCASVSHSHCKFLPYIQPKSTLPQFKNITPCPVTTGLATKTVPIFPVGPFRYWQAAIRSPRSLLFSRLNSPNSLSLSSWERCSSPWIIFVALLWTNLVHLLLFKYEPYDTD